MAATMVVSFTSILYNYTNYTNSTGRIHYSYIVYVFFLNVL